MPTVSFSGQEILEMIIVEDLKPAVNDSHFRHAITPTAMAPGSRATNEKRDVTIIPGEPGDSQAPLPSDNGVFYTKRHPRINAIRRFSGESEKVAGNWQASISAGVELDLLECPVLYRSLLVNQ
jgi:hypothetical protein